MTRGPTMPPEPDSGGSSARANEGEVFVARRDGFHVAEANFLQHRRQLSDGALSACVAENREQMADGGVALRGEVHRHEAAARLEDPPDLSEALSFQIERQVVQHEAARDEIEASVGKRERLD